MRGLGGKQIGGSSWEVKRQEGYKKARPANAPYNSSSHELILSQINARKKPKKKILVAKFVDVVALARQLRCTQRPLATAPRG